MDQKLPLSIGILSLGDHQTLLNSLNSYKSSGLLNYVAQVYIFFQKISDSDCSIADSFNIEYFGSEKNLGISGGYQELLKHANQPNFLFLENDWLIPEDSYPLVTSQLSDAVKLINQNTSDVVRLRSQKHPGDPLWTLQFRGKELTRPEHLLDCLHWIEDPSLNFPEYIKKITPNWFTTTASFANWTNNPHLIRTSWGREVLLPKLGDKDIERSLQKWWQQTNYVVAQGKGLFTHYRLPKIRGIEIYLHPNEALSNHIRREKDFFEPDILDYLKSHYQSQNTIVDVGANIGNHALYFANFLQNRKIICFEPVPDNFNLLQKNLNPYPNTQLYQLALSDKKENLKVKPNPDNMGASKVDQSGNLKVNAITLDSLKLQNITLLKIDVENYEPQVLEGAKDTIERCHPLILIEDGNLSYAKLLPDYELEMSWPKHKTYLYRWKKSKRPYLLSLCSYTPGVDNYKRTLPKLENGVEWINVDLEPYPGHLFRWDHIPQELDHNRIFIFTDTADVIFQKPIPLLSPNYIYVANEGEIFGKNRFWRSILRRYQQFNHLATEIIYNVGTFACTGKIMDRWVSFLQGKRQKIRRMAIEQLIFNEWLRQPEIYPLLKEHPDLFTSLYANLEKGTTILNSNKQFINKNGDLYSIVHFNGNTKELLAKTKLS